MTAEKRHKAMVTEAEALLKNNDTSAAEQKVRSVLLENPAQRDARSILWGIEEGRTRGKLAAKTLKANLKRPITLDFHDASIRGIFDAIARSSGVNYVFDRDVRPDLRATIQLRNKQIDDAVKILLVTNQLEQRVLDDDTSSSIQTSPPSKESIRSSPLRRFILPMRMLSRWSIQFAVLSKRAI